MVAWTSIRQSSRVYIDSELATDGFGKTTLIWFRYCYMCPVGQDFHFSFTKTARL